MDETAMEVVHGRQNPLIDPSLQIWGWEIPVYLFLGGLVAGLMILAAARELKTDERAASRALRFAPFLGLLLLTLGMIALFLDLEFKTHVYRFYLAFKPTSPMSWGSWILVLVYPVGFLQGMGSLSASERGKILGGSWVRKLKLARPLEALLRYSDAHRKAMLWTSIALGIGLGVYTGLLLGTMAARPLWNTALLGPLFLVSGVSTGAALLLLLGLGEDDRHALVRWDLVAIGVELTLIAIMLLAFASGDRTAQAAGQGLLGGPYTSAFWALVIGMGLVVPLLMEWAELRRGLPFRAITPVFILLGGLALRFVMLGAGQASSFRALVMGGG
jgi:formate-dependent nitrite reductase membrane component NrfD